MPRVNSARSSTFGEESNEALMQEELERLQNQLRILKNNQKTYTDETQNSIERQFEEMSHLKRDNENLLSTLELARSTANCKLDDRNLQRLEELNNDHDELLQSIEEEKQAIDKLNMNIQTQERKNRQQQKELGGVAGASQNHKQKTQKKIQTMDNRLDKENKQYNEILKENRLLREEIEKLRNERRLYDEIYVKLNAELLNCRAEKEELTEQATSCYDQRDDANNKILIMKEKNDKDEAQFKQETRDLQRIIDHDKRLRDFMQDKSNDRADWKRKEEEKKLKHGSEADRARDQQRRLIGTFEEAFHHIKDITKEEDLEIIVNEFIRKEDDNFALFQFVNEQNNIQESLQEDIENLNHEISHFNNEQATLEAERQKILAELDIRIAKVTEEANHEEQRHTEVSKVLDQLKSGVQSIFNKANCDEEIIKQMLAQDQEVSDRNVMLYMGSVEQKCNEMLAVQYYMQTQKYYTDDDAPPPEHGITLGMNFNPKLQQKETTIMPPNIGEAIDEESETEDDVRPLSQGELMTKVMKGIAKREIGGKSQIRTIGRTGKKN